MFRLVLAVTLAAFLVACSGVAQACPLQVQAHAFAVAPAAVQTFAVAQVAQPVFVQQHAVAVQSQAVAVQAQAVACPVVVQAAAPVFRARRSFSRSVSRSVSVAR